MTSSEMPMAIWSVVTISPFSAFAISVSRLSIWARRKVAVDRARVTSGGSRLWQPRARIAAITARGEGRTRHAMERDY